MTVARTLHSKALRHVFFVALALFALAAPGWAQYIGTEPEIVIEPASPVAGEAFDIVITGQALCFANDPPQLLGSTIEIRVTTCVCCVIGVPPGPDNFELRSTILGLDVGEYTVRFADIEETLALATFQVSEAPNVLKLFPDPPVIGDNDLARVIVTGSMDCVVPEFSDVEVIDDQVLVTARVPEVVVGPPCSDEPLDWAFAAEFGPLTPGLYTVDGRLVNFAGEVVEALSQTAELQVIDRSDSVFLRDGRFEVAVEWSGHDGDSGAGRPVAGRPSDDSALFSFFEPDNWEVMVKMVDGCNFNDHWWVFGAAATDVEYTITVTDTETGAVQTWINPLGTRAPAITEVESFDCP